MIQDEILTPVSISECFLQHVHTTGYLAYFGSESAPNWQFCKPTVVPLNLTRSNGTSASSMGTPTIIWQSNPYNSMPDGFYANGTHQITLTSGTVDLNLGGVSFNTSLQQMAKSHWTGVQPEADPLVLAIETTLFTPVLNECQMLVTVPRNSSWTELN